MATSLPRITAKIDIETRELLSQAAAITGMSSINSFVLSAAIEKARQIIERERSLKLSQEDAMLLIKALDEESSPNPRLKQAAKHYSNKRAGKA